MCKQVIMRMCGFLLAFKFPHWRWRTWTTTCQKSFGGCTFSLSKNVSVLFTSWVCLVVGCRAGETTAWDGHICLLKYKKESAAPKKTYCAFFRQLRRQKPIACWTSSCDDICALRVLKSCRESRPLSDVACRAIGSFFSFCVATRMQSRGEPAFKIVKNYGIFHSSATRRVMLNPHLRRLKIIGHKDSVSFQSKMTLWRTISTG